MSDVKLQSRPIVRVACGPEDRERLRGASVARASAQGDRGFRNQVVLKPWGHEFLCHASAAVAVWCLHLRSGKATSLHCHRHTRTSLVVSSGTLELETLDTRHLLPRGSAVTVEPGAFHRLRAVDSGGARVFEIESPRDKDDLVRLHDEHGRVGQGYEGVEHAVHADLGRFEHFWLPDQPSSPGIALHRLADIRAREAFRPRRGGWLSLCEAPSTEIAQPRAPGQLFQAQTLDNLGLDGPFDLLELE